MAAYRQQQQDANQGSNEAASQPVPHSARHCLSAVGQSANQRQTNAREPLNQQQNSPSEAMLRQGSGIAQQGVDRPPEQGRGENQQHVVQRNLCMKCHERVRTIKLGPCNHLVFCNECFSDDMRCPECHRWIEDMTDVSEGVQAHESHSSNAEPAQRRRAQANNRPLERIDEENPQELQEANRQLRCRVCHERDINTILMPCGHLVVCEVCVGTLTCCCLCNETIRAKARVYME